MQTKAPALHRANWFYALEGRTCGPVTEAELEALLRSGKIRQDTLVCSEAVPQWKPCRETQFALSVEFEAAPKLAPSSGEASTASSGRKPAHSDTIHEAVCRDCRGIFTTDTMLQHGGSWVCSTCMNDYIERMGLVKLIYAGFGIRLAAKFLDALIVATVFVLPLAFWAHHKALTGDASWFVTLPFVSAAAYPLVYPFYSIFFVGRYGATPGKMLCKIRITDPKGRKLNYKTAVKRYFAEIFSTTLWGLGYLMAAFDGQRRTLHDRICKTRVVSKITKPGPRRTERGRLVRSVEAV